MITPIPDFCGREAELRLFHSRVDALLQGRPSFPPFLQFYGLGGIGKTALLGEYLKWCQAHSIACATLDFDESRFQRGEQSHLAVAESLAEQIMPLMPDSKWPRIVKEHRELLGSLGKEPPPEQAIEALSRLDELEHQVIEGAIGSLVEFSKQRPLVLLVDEVQDIPTETREWLETELLSKLAENELFLLVLAGRKHWQWQDEVLARKVETHELQPFTSLETCSLLKALSDLPVDREVYGQMEWSTGRHPYGLRVAMATLQKLAHQDAKECISSQDYAGYKGRIAEAVAEEVIYPFVMSGIEPQWWKEFCLLISPLERFNTALLESIRPEIELPGLKSIEISRHYERVVETLARWDDFVKPDGLGDYALHITVRRPLSLHLRLRETERFSRINELAHKYYSELVRREKGDDARHVVEAFYHQVSWLVTSPEPMEPSEIEGKLTEKLHDWITMYYDSYNPKKFSEQENTVTLIRKGLAQHEELKEIAPEYLSILKQILDEHLDELQERRRRAVERRTITAPVQLWPEKKDERTPLFIGEREAQDQTFEELLKRIKRRQCVLLLGPGLPREAGLPSGTDLALTLARECDYPPVRPLTFSQIAQYYAYETHRGRLGLFRRVRELLERSITTRGLSSYDLIVEIDQLNHPIVTTNWDDQLEQAFRRRGKPVTVVRYNEEVSLLPQPHVIIKLHGDFGNRLDEIVLTRDDYVKAYKQIAQPSGLFALLGSWLATRTMLFVGYSLEDEDFRLLYELVTSAVGAGAPMHYAVMPDVAPALKDYWQSHGVFILDYRPLPFFEEVFVRMHRFVDREDELEYICTRATRPYIEIHGFAGCGKTELLREVADRYELTGIWVQAFISFEDEETSIEPLDLVAEIMRQTTGRQLDRRRLMSRAQAEIANERGIKPSEVPEPETKALAAKLAAAELGDHLAHQRALLLFDSSVEVPTPLLRWIEGVLIPTLEEKVLDPQGQLRLVFAGRSPLPWRSPLVKKNLYVRSLTPFSEGAVGAMLDNFTALKLREPLPKGKRAAIIAGVLDITSGHPQCTLSVLEEIARKEFDIPPDYFVADRARLFEQHVGPVAEKEILGRVPTDLWDIFRLVCIFRRLMPDTLGVLIHQGHIGEGITDPMLLLGELRDKTRLITPRPDPMYDIDPVVRRILAMKMELKNPQRYAELNDLAAKTYEHWILGQNATGEPLRYPAAGELQIAYAIEALFHLTRLLYVRGAKGDEAAQAMQYKLNEFLQALRSPLGPGDLTRLVWQLKDRLEHDHELLREVSALVPDGGYHVLVEPVEAFLGGLEER